MCEATQREILKFLREHRHGLDGAVVWVALVFDKKKKKYRYTKTRKEKRRIHPWDIRAHLVSLGYDHGISVQEDLDYLEKENLIKTFPHRPKGAPVAELVVEAVFQADK